jgi:acyl carrier protein
MRDKLRQFITKEIMRDPKYPLKDDEPMISGGLIDSFSLVELQLYVEKEFGVRIDDTDLTAESANTLNQIVGIIERYQS